jgi:hypothetical protein
MYASNPFGTRTHILSSPDSKVKINGEPLTVLKDQLCRVGTQSYEHSILTQIHSPEKVPGVVEAVYREVIKIPGDFCSSREKHRLGLRQMGKPFTSIPTVAQMLEIVFDILEGSLSCIIYFLYAHSFAVLRYLRFERQSFIVTSAKEMFYVSRTISAFRLVLRLVEQTRRLGQRDYLSVSLNTFLARGV